MTLGIAPFAKIIDTDSDVLKENANVNGSTPLGKMNAFASETMKWFTDEKLLEKEIREAEEENVLYIHDKDYYPTGTTTCCQIPLGKLLQTGFHTGHGYIRPPKSITTAFALAAIVVQSNQNFQHGGQAYPAIDRDLAPFVVLSYEKYKAEGYTDDGAWEKTKAEAAQAAEAFIHNLNTMHSRGGGQVPFVSINFGTDISEEGRLITAEILAAVQNGLGRGETPIFPIQIFKVKDGINGNPEDPNYDLFLKAVETSSRRLYPNFSFLDAPFNRAYYREDDPDTEVAYMGCRTRVMGNVNGEETVSGRGNLSFSSVNLVRLALKADGDLLAFFTELNKAVALCMKQLHGRYDFQGSFPASSFPFLYAQGVWRGGETLNPGDRVEPLLREGSLSVGFIGLAEALQVLTGSHHGESDEAWQLGQEIIAEMRRLTDEETARSGRNVALLATPAEGLSGKFVARDREMFGDVKGITDKAYYTNSFHLPVYADVTVKEKINREAPFHCYCNGGHITYVEVDGNASANTQAFQEIIAYMKQAGIGYGSINHPVDHCFSCGYQGMIGDECPTCGEEDPANIQHIRRITGYLVGGLDRWNEAKRAEEKDRVKHR
ncbi:anaerobic ribonucleoside triphosphate reductase [Salisediminibacterium halotolerans]|uniref:anaerobic ribonucleoside triphosphate reductase n=1 Tax=Salisediminibacterium halotolerans TaxID=517425 RepID=UPI000EB36174|nr:anaerobic ribonucleoside triphosphate reductase [Salisediminibacterium halotolerans]RLJ73217.1 ribonucleoside-triphosphate reductase class III catalytic subunit [Actinophytocola xinjiangensis]RPE86639.1 ribonucleoside-triphosphate reductase class III catalytic subunit [Salisediminibacterium halotolerans]TWG34014.1 ribonucleoside-triphosphate reductase class III catalytic subunit [Salisediminibacterium halotolerans]GEL09006.1 ribonucleoside-triphosphate reductase [Salisediminibacterium haloto